MRLLFFSPDYAVEDDHPSWNGAAWYRCALPARELAANGHEARMTGVILANDQTGRLAGFMEDDSMYDDAEIVVLHAWTVRGGAEQIRRARRAGQVVIGDIDDLMWQLPIEHRSTSWDPMISRDRNVLYLRNNLMACDAITVSTPAIGDFIRARWPGAPPVYVVRNCLDFGNFAPMPLRREVRALGWNGNLSWRADDFGALRSWLPGFLEDHDLFFIHVGYHPSTPHFADSLGIDPRRVEERPITRFADFHFGSCPLRGIDLQVIPLEDVPYNDAKSALKGLESAAWGVPFVASPAWEYRHVFDSHGDLESQLEAALTYEVRGALHAHQYVRAMTYDIAERWADWELIYSVVAGTVEAISSRTPHPSGGASI